MSRKLSFCVKPLIVAAATASAVVSVWSAEAFGLQWPQGNDVQIVEKYLSFVDRHAKKHCPAGTEEKINELYKDYKSAGRYLPYLDGGELDKVTVKEGLPLLRQKADWIKQTATDLKKSKQFPEADSFKPLQALIDDLLKLKLAEAKSPAPSQKIAAQSKEKLSALHKAYDGWVSELPFLLSFNYPVDHLANRAAFEKASGSGQTGLKNQIYFKRRILEDGALRSGGRLSDIYERSTFDSIKTRLAQNKSAYLSNDLRADLEWLSARVRSTLRQGQGKMVSRLNQWESNTRKDIEFYEALVGAEQERAPTNVVSHHTVANKRLAQYVRQKQAEIYAALASEPAWIRALFAFDQILLNEVGRATNDNYRERRDVAQVVLNRKDHPFYSKLSADEPMTDHLRDVATFKGKKTENYPWLNVLFKDGQFSFTHYFIPAVEYSICPDFYKVAKLTRRKNTFLAIDKIKNPDKDFPALRYFSRFSMTGKIDMSSLWENYRALPEQPGKAVKNPKQVLAAIKKNKYRYLYDFKDIKGETYSVIEVGRETYSVKDLFTKPEVYQFRDPDKFRFFAARK